MRKIPPLASKQLESLLSPISEIKPFPKNYKEHPQSQVSKLCKSLRAFGWTKPVCVNINGEIVAGHGMVEAAKEEGYTHIPVLYVTFDENQTKAYVVADNRLSEIAETNQDMLSDLLSEISEIPDFDIEAVGFTLDEIDLDLESKEVVEDEFNPDDVKEYRCREGDLWQLGRHYLFVGDCTDEGNVKTLLQNNTVDILITDPPYGVDYSSKNEMLNSFDEGNRVQRPIQNDAIENYREFFGNFLKVIPFSDYNTIYVFMSGKELHNVRLAFDDANLTYSTYLVWVKNNHVISRQDYSSKHEFCVYGWKNHHKFYGDFSTTILEFDKPVKSDLHPTMKPIPLFSKLIQDGSLPGMNVYDPFGGSGTSIMACEQLGRNCFSMELESYYANVILTRWEQFTGKTAKKLN